MELLLTEMKKLIGNANSKLYIDESDSLMPAFYMHTISVNYGQISTTERALVKIKEVAFSAYNSINIRTDTHIFQVP